VITFSGPARPVATKRDIKQIMFDREQIMIYKKIKEAKSCVDNYSNMHRIVPDARVRRSKFL